MTDDTVAVIPKSPRAKWTVAFLQSKGLGVVFTMKEFLAAAEADHPGKWTEKELHNSLTHYRRNHVIELQARGVYWRVRYMTVYTSHWDRPSWMIQKQRTRSKKAYV